MTIRSENALQGRYFVAQFIANSTDAGFVMKKAPGGFDTYDDASVQLDRTKPDRVGETWVVVQVIDEVKAKSHFVAVLPPDLIKKGTE